MASARKTPSNPAVFTYGTGAANRDFTSLSTWEGLSDNTLTSGHGEVSISNVSATRFDLEEALSFSSSGATATCRGTNLARTKMWYVVTSGTPTTADTITGDTSGATADIDTIDSTNTGCGQILDCYDDAASFDDTVFVAGSTNNTTYYRLIRAAAGQGHDGTPSNGVFFDVTSDALVFDLSEANVHIQDLIASLTLNTASFRTLVRPGAAQCKVVGMILVDGANSGSGSINGYAVAAGNNNIIALSLCHNIDNDGMNLNSNTVYVYNCTIEGSGFRGINNRGGTVVAINTLIGNSAGEDFGGPGTPDWTGSDYNASGDTTAPGTSSRTSQTFTFVNSGSDDFHLSGSDAGARDFGTDLSGDATFAFDDDINDGTMGGGKAGQTFNVWDIGFDEPTPAVAVPRNRRRREAVPITLPRTTYAV